MLIAITGLPSQRSAAAAMRMQERFVPTCTIASTSGPSSAWMVSTTVFSGIWAMPVQDFARSGMSFFTSKPMSVKYWRTSAFEIG